MLRVRLLGEVEFRGDRGRIAGLDGGRVGSLLAYLALNPGTPVPRPSLAALLWPDATEGEAGANLRRLLQQLRRTPDAGSLVEVTPEAVGWRTGTGLAVDVAEFEAAAARGAAAHDALAAIQALEQAASHYRGDLLPACRDEWVIPRRERLRAGHVEVLARLAHRLEEAGDVGGALRHGEALLRADPLHEATYRQLMRLHARVGEHTRALREYHTCVRVLEDELGVAPSAATRQAYADLVDAPADAEPVATGPAVPPFVGRRSQAAGAEAACRAAADGFAQLLVISGEAGLGKTRLVGELERWCGRSGIATARSRAFAGQGRLAYAPVLDWLRSPALRPGLAALDDAGRTEVVRLLPELLAEHPRLRRPEPAVDGRRRRLFEALAGAVLGGRRPLLLVLHDAQWCDRDTLEFLHFLLRTARSAPLLVAVTVRPDEIAQDDPVEELLVGLRALDRVVEIPLPPLVASETAALAEALGAGHLSAAESRQLHRETEGNPLFVVETVRADLAGSAERHRPGRGGVHAVPLPPKVQAVIEDRLAHLSPPAMELVAVAATTGREFDTDLLARASGLRDGALAAALDELWRRRIVREHGSGYDFSHGLLREVAYAGIGPARRRRLHLAVARALAWVHAADPDPVSGQLAAHHDAAGHAAEAVAWYRRAAEVAQRVYANTEALPYLTRGLELVRALPPGPSRDLQELGVRVSLGTLFVELRGYGAAETLENYSRAEQLITRQDEQTGASVLRGLAVASNCACDFGRALSLGDRIRALAEHDGHPTYEVEGQYVLGAARFWRGELEASREHFEAAISGYRASDHVAHVSQFAHDPMVVCLSRLALTLWHLGRPEDASARTAESLALGTALGHPYSLAYALAMAAWISCDKGESERIAELVRAGAALSGERGITLWSSLAEFWLGWLDARRGRPDIGTARIRDGLAGLSAAGHAVLRTQGLWLLADAQLLGGAPGASLATVVDALAWTARTKQRYLDAELHRLHGELLLAGAGGRPAPDAAEAALRRALAVARRQKAAVFEVRAALSLARWRCVAGPAGTSAEARRILEHARRHFPANGWIPELDEAAKLLGQM